MDRRVSLKKPIMKFSRSKADKLTNFTKLSADKGVGMYLESLQSKKLVHPPKYKTELKGSSHLIMNHSLRNEKESNEWLQFVKYNTMITKRKLLDEEWQSLRNHEKMLGGCFKTYDDFVRKNYEKRQRSIQKLKELDALESSQSERYDDLHQRYDRIFKIKELMEETINKYIFYEDFLRTVVRIAPQEFKQPYDIVTRYEALMNAKDMIKKDQEELFSKLQDGFNAYLKMNKDNELKLIGLMNKVNELYTRYEDAKSKVNKWESQVGFVFDMTVEVKRSLLDVKHSCWGLYENCCGRDKNSLFDKDMDTRGQLALIKRVLRDLENIEKESMKLGWFAKSRLLCD